MEINKLKTFIDLAQTLSFSETAAHLYITQSSVSKHIKSLEQEIGQPLFIRNQKHVSLSSYGHGILPYAQEIIHNYEQIQQAIKEINSDQQKQIILGTIPTFSNYQAFQDITSYNQSHSETNIYLKEYETSALLNSLLKNEIDLAFFRKIDKLPNNFEQISVKQESFKLYLSKNDPLKSEEKIKIKQIKDRSLLTLDKDSLLQKPIIKLCKDSGFTPKIGFVSDRVSSLLEMIKNEQGVAILMDSIPIPQGVIVKDITPTITGELMFIKKKGHHFHALNELWQTLKSNYSK